jgi:hypothetical protein
MPPPTVCEGLLRDIESSCSRFKVAVEALTHPELEEHRRRAVEILEQIASDVEQVLNGGHAGADFASVAVHGSQLDVFRRIYFPFFVHCGADERYLTRLAERMADESAFGIVAPLLGAFSGTGYWTAPTLSAVCVPAGEHAQILTFPDLAHELAHILLEEREAEFSASFYSEALGPYTAGLGAVAGDAHFGSRLYAQYQDWLAEFAADVIATYVCGPAYGWQHLRLRAQSGHELGPPWYPAEPSPDEEPERFTHPADSARSTVIARTLDATGQTPSATRLRTEWRALTATAAPAPATYAASYDESVLVDMVRMTLSWCSEEGLTPFASAGANAVVACIDRAWAQQLAEPVAFAAKEPELVAGLRALVTSGP